MKFKECSNERLEKLGKTDRWLSIFKKKPRVAFRLTAETEREREFLCFLHEHLERVLSYPPDPGEVLPTYSRKVSQGSFDIYQE